MHRIVVFLAPLTLLLAAPGQVNIPEWVHQHNQKWYASLHAGDATALAASYSTDAVIVTPKQSLRGREAIEAFHRKNFETTRYKCTWIVDGAHVLDRQAAVWGTDNCNESLKTGGAPWVSRGRWLSIYERQTGGSWLVVRESYDALKP